MSHTRTNAACLDHLEARLLLSAENRSIDGAGNNLAHPDWGAAHTVMPRIAASDYADGLSVPSGDTRPSPRHISNVINDQPASILNDRRMSDFVWQWGQFLDHDMDLIELASPAEPLNIPVPTGDPFFDPQGTGTKYLPLSRSEYSPATGTTSPRQQINSLTSFIDGSNVYGSDAAHAASLRTFVDGLLKSSAGNLLPKDADGLFMAGDVRVNEQIGLTAMHTLFMREHNRLAAQLKLKNPSWNDEQLYQRARKIVGAQTQVITYNEFLPALLGGQAPSRHGRYNPALDPSILNEFAAAAYRVGHSMLSPQLLRVYDDGSVSNVPLRDAFFNPELIDTNEELESLLRGLASQTAQEIDTQIVDGVRNFLFGAPGSGGADLPSLNIQRGRDHGLPDYNSTREAFGLKRVKSFSQITKDRDVQDALRELYGTVDNIDLWVGGLAETHLPGSSVGPLFGAILREQFTRLRDGDRFWYENDPAFTSKEIAELRRTRLADIIRRNTGITDIDNDVFHVKGPAVKGGGKPVQSEDIRSPARIAAIFSVKQIRRPAGESLDIADAGSVFAA